MCIDYPTSIVLLYKIIYNVDFMLGQRHRQLTHINQHCQSYSVNRIGLHRPSVFLMLGLRRKRWTNVKPILAQCVVLTETAH